MLYFFIIKILKKMWELKNFKNTSSSNNLKDILESKDENEINRYTRDKEIEFNILAKEVELSILRTQSQGYYPEQQYVSDRRNWIKVNCEEIKDSWLVFNVKSYWQETYFKTDKNWYIYIWDYKILKGNGKEKIKEIIIIANLVNRIKFDTFSYILNQTKEGMKVSDFNFSIDLDKLKLNYPWDKKWETSYINIISSFSEYWMPDLKSNKEFANYLNSIKNDIQ